MSYKELGSAIEEVVCWFNKVGCPYALVGGLAVSFRTIERATKGIDFAIFVESDSEAEKVVRALQHLGFHPVTCMENKTHNLISTVRLLSDKYPGVFLDLLFSTSGIENEVVNSSDIIEILPGLQVRVASLSSLVAMKVLLCTNGKRKQDLLDLDILIADSTAEDLEESRRFIALIESRGFNRGRDLHAIFNKLLSEHSF